MIRYSINYFFKNKEKIIKFLIVGASAFIINILSYYIYLTVLFLIKNNNFNWQISNLIQLKDFFSNLKIFINADKFHKDISNIISIEISVLFNFYLSRNWTWNHIEKHQGKKLFFQCIKFHLAILPGMLCRVILFSIFNHYFQMHDLLNIIIGVGVAMIFNFLFYDKIVFSQKKKSES